MSKPLDAVDLDRHGEALRVWLLLGGNRTEIEVVSWLTGSGLSRDAARLVIDEAIAAGLVARLRASDALMPTRKT